MEYKDKEDFKRKEISKISMIYYTEKEKKENKILQILFKMNLKKKFNSYSTKKSYGNQIQPQEIIIISENDSKSLKITIFCQMQNFLNVKIIVKKKNLLKIKKEKIFLLGEFKVGKKSIILKDVINSFTNTLNIDENEKR